MRNYRVFERPSTKEVVAAELKAGDIVVQGSEDAGYTLEKIRAVPRVEPGTNSMSIYFRTGSSDDTRGYFNIPREKIFSVIVESNAN